MAYQQTGYYHGLKHVRGVILTIQDILAALGGVTAVAIAIVAACWKLVDTWITTWITKRVGRGLERDADHYRHELSQDMERFKDELARTQSVERLRAEMRKVVAEKLFEKRLTAYHELNIAIMSIPGELAGSATMPPESRFREAIVAEKIGEMKKLWEQHLLYVPPEFANDFRELLARLLLIFPADGWGTMPALPQDGKVLTNIRELVRSLGNQIDALYKALPDDLANAVAQA
ncbi:hypothetical protein [Burkholderia vietnamiensis]|uniref:hypothetical protein n=1 Tax=Burkholderia vietnamiensis TaxID=60552 RepID=UPI0012D90DE9|nr:hypothetical protein [Burkholderia vietnamiensis]